ERRPAASGPAWRCRRTGRNLGRPQREVVVPGQASFAVLLSTEQLREVEEQCGITIAPGGDYEASRTVAVTLRAEPATPQAREAGLRGPVVARQAATRGAGGSRCAWRQSR